MTFDELIKSNPSKPVVALFYGAACAPCERLKPVLRAVCKSAGVELQEFNSANELPAIKALGLRSVPSVVLVAHGEARLLFTGALDAETVRSKFSMVGIYREPDTTIDAN